jgi:hypothetical protein
MSSGNNNDYLHIFIYIYKITVAIFSICYKNDFYDETSKHTHIEGEASFYDSYSA